MKSESLTRCDLPASTPKNAKALQTHVSQMVLYVNALEYSRGSHPPYPPGACPSSSFGPKSSSSFKGKAAETHVTPPRGDTQYARKDTGHNDRGNRRMFGPTAVVQLRSVQNRLRNVNVLAQNLHSEFSRYGYAVRFVRVKVGLGIAFVEYDCPEGVRAACAAWGYGVQKEGEFAGIPLSVPEKKGDCADDDPAECEIGAARMDQEDRRAVFNASSSPQVV